MKADEVRQHLLDAQRDRLIILSRQCSRRDNDMKPLMFEDVEFIDDVPHIDGEPAWEWFEASTGDW